VIAKRWYWFGLLGSAALLAVAYFYFQLEKGLDPCPLCMFQRACLVGVASVCLLGLITNPKKIGAKVIAFFCSLFSILGLIIAGRQVWLQHLPADQVPECGPGLDFMLETFPVMEMLQSVFSGSGECAEVQWLFLSFSMGEWMVAVFFVMTLISLRLLLARERNYFSGALGR